MRWIKERWPPFATLAVAALAMVEGYMGAGAGLAVVSVVCIGVLLYTDWRYLS